MARILLGAIHTPVTAARSIYWALRDMGHEVITAGPFQNVMDWAGSKPLYCYEWQPHIDTTKPLYPLTWKPDLVLQIDWVTNPIAGVPNVLYAIDNHVGDYGGGDGFDKIFVGHSWGHLAELPNAEWLPAGYDPRYHKHLERQARKTDVLMIGNLYPNRVELIAELGRLDIGGLLWTNSGHAWEDYNAVYNDARIALVKSKCGDLSGRVFEHMAAGCLVVMDRVRDADKIGLVEGEHYLGYDTPDECADVIRSALTVKEWDRDKFIAADGHKWVQPHTWDARAKTILESVGIA